MKRARYHHGDLPDALLKVAEALIAEKGVHGFSLREAARGVGVDVSACYRHFADRDAVLHAIARRGFTKLAERMEQVVERHKPGPTVLRALGYAYLDFARENPSAFRVMFGPQGYVPRDPRARGEYVRGGYDVLLDTVRAWRKRADDERLALAMWGAVHGVACLVVDGVWKKESPKAILDVLFDRLLA